MKQKKSSALAALTHAALALPGLAHAAQIDTDYLYSRYSEAGLDQSKLAGGSEDRYEIDSHHFRVVGTGKNQVVGLDLTIESMSGASPWYVLPDANGRPVQVMTGASIEENRAAARLSLETRIPGLPDVTPLFSLGYSDEDDYTALSFGTEINYEFDQLTFSAGVGYSDDTVEPVQQVGVNRVSKEDRSSFTIFGGLAFIISENTVAQVSVNFLQGNGFLSDPYKQSWIVSESNVTQDSRPDSRSAGAWSAKLRHHVPLLNASAHVDYRYYHDEWEVKAHTLELAWEQSFGNIRVAPSLRWYSQSQANFYAPFYETRRADGLATSDYRLSPFGALSFRLEVGRPIGKDWYIGAGAEFYEASEQYAIKEVGVENPGLIEYTAFQVRLAYRYK